MPLLFMLILPQIDLRDTVISQAANGLQGGCFVGEQEAARRLSGGQDALSFELNIDPLGGNAETNNERRITRNLIKHSDFSDRFRIIIGYC